MRCQGGPTWLSARTPFESMQQAASHLRRRRARRRATCGLRHTCMNAERKWKKREVWGGAQEIMWSVCVRTGVARMRAR